LTACGVPRDAVTITVVPGAFELPLAAMALAKTRRYGCIIALGCVIRGKTRHFQYISSEAASGLQLAALETGTPVSFGVLTVDNRRQAEARIDRAVDAVHSALEMANVFSQLRATAH
jgi:6,7-dimethyl-8-ribityllumazine synthase